MNQHRSQYTQSNDPIYTSGQTGGLLEGGREQGTQGGCVWPPLEAFPDLAPGLVMGCFRSPQVWGGMAWRRAFAGRGDQSAPARHLVGQLLGDTVCADDAVWVTAELVSNALQHTRSGAPRGFFVVEVLRGLHVVRIVVYDLGGHSVPDFARAVRAAHRAVAAQAEQGRGLAGVAALAVRVGVAGDAITGHAVWAELALTVEPQVQDQAPAHVQAGPEPMQVVLPQPSGDDEAGNGLDSASADELAHEPRTSLPAAAIPASDSPARGREEEVIVLDPPRALREAS